MITLIFKSYSPVSYSQTKDKSIDIVYFYISVCEACRDAEKNIEHFGSIIKAKDENLKFNFIQHNTYSKYATELVNLYFDYYDVEKESRNIPVLFIGDNYYSGQAAIEKGLNNELDKILQGNIPKTPILKLDSNNNSLKDNFNFLTGISVFVAGLINGLNPCSFSMLLFLISLILVKNIDILKVGFSFIFGKFIMYLLLGTVLYNLLAHIPTTSYMIVTKIILGVIIFLIAIFNIYDFFAANSEEYDKIKMQLPSKVRKWNHKFIKVFVDTNNGKRMIISTIALGMIISIGEFLCTGQLFLTTIIYVLKSDASLLSIKAFVYLTIYVISFLIPISIVVLILAKTKELFDVSEKLREKMPLIKLITAIVLLILGIIILFVF